MVNGLGVLGWGVGGIEAEAAMLGQPVSMLIPQVIGFKLTGKLREGATATDLVLRVTEMLRRRASSTSSSNTTARARSRFRSPTARRSRTWLPNTARRCGIFPVDEVTLKYLRLTGRPEDRVQLVENYCASRACSHDAESPKPSTATRWNSISTRWAERGRAETPAGPRRPPAARGSLHNSFPQLAATGGAAVATKPNELANASVVIAAISRARTPRTRASMVAAGLLARNAATRAFSPRSGSRPPWLPAPRSSQNICSEAAYSTT